jgi:hypothetical protein
MENKRIDSIDPSSRKRLTAIRGFGTLRDKLIVNSQCQIQGGFTRMKSFGSINFELKLIPSLI